MPMFLPGPGPLEQYVHPVDVTPAPPDTWAATAQRATQTPCYSPPRSQAILVPDASTNSFADWTPQPSLNSSMPKRYATVSSVMGAADQPTQVYTQTAINGPQRRYVGPASQTFITLDATTNSFADWVAQPTQKAIQTPFYAAPRSRVTLTPDASTNSFADWTPTAAQRSTQIAFYKAPLSQAILTTDASTNTFADVVLEPTISRQVARYSAPVSRSVTTADNTAVAGTDQVNLSIASRTVGFYAAPRSVALVTTDTSTNTFADWTPQPAMNSSMPKRYQTTSSVMGAGDQPLDSASLSITSRPFRFYAPPASLTPLAADNQTATPDTWASIVQSRQGSVLNPRRVAPSLIPPSGAEMALPVALNTSFAPPMTRRSSTSIVWTPTIVAIGTKGYAVASDAGAYGSTAADLALGGSLALDAAASGSAASDALKNSAASSDAQTYGSTAGDS